MSESFTIQLLRRVRISASLLTAPILLAWLVAPEASNAVEREVPMTTKARIVNSGSTNSLGFTLTIAENGVRLRV